jgi:hypothetical protein
MKRIAYIGLSSPLFYDYGTPGERSPADQSSSPNPILDSPFGTLLLFDEIWFLSRSLCPQNMREVSYVKFLDETIDLEFLVDIDTAELIQKLDTETALMKRYDNLRKGFDLYSETVQNVGVRWDAAADNHTHSLSIGPILRSGNSMNPENIIFDIEVANRLNRGFKGNVEYISNSFGQRWLDQSPTPTAQAKLTELLLINGIPNYLSRFGPYHECIEEVRENKFLSDFRKWMTKTELKYDEKELWEIKKEIESVLEKAQRELFLKHLDPDTHFNSVGKLVGGTLLDVILPYSSTALSLIEEIKNLDTVSKIRWQGFIVSAKESIGAKSLNHD